MPYVALANTFMESTEGNFWDCFLYSVAREHGGAIFCGVFQIAIFPDFSQIKMEKFIDTSIKWRYFFHAICRAKTSSELYCPYFEEVFHYECSFIHREGFQVFKASSLH
jgi:predicted outer membrane repeat protein